MSATSEILVVDDDAPLREVVRYALSREGFRVREAENGVRALEAVAQSAPDLIVLDVMMPELDGLGFCRQLRLTSRVPVIFLSSRDEEIDRVLGLELGGDDYLPKPFSPRELVSRVKAVLRRARPAPEPERVLVWGALRVDLEGFRATVGEEELTLTVTELRMLAALLRRPGRVYSRDDLVGLAYPGVHHVADRTVDSHIRGVRAKLREVGLDPIETVHGVGFRLRAP